MFHNIYHLLFIVFRVAFENKPHYFVVLIEFYMDFIYLIDLVRCFTEPYVMFNGKTVSNRRKITVHYVNTWFVLDVYSFYPLAYMRYISKWENGSINSYEMFISQNFERLPRFYKMMLLVQVFRGRNGSKYFKDFIKELNIKIEY
jgi:hypothetical protein